MPRDPTCIPPFWRLCTQYTVYKRHQGSLEDTQALKMLSLRPFQLERPQKGRCAFVAELVWFQLGNHARF